MKGSRFSILLFYRYRFLIVYTLFGFFSLVVEMIVVRGLNSFNFHRPVSTGIGFIVGLILAFVLNIRFNFHVAPPKRKRALTYFIIISTFSFCIQLLVRREFINRGMPVDLSRFAIAGAFFLFSYVLHRRFSFSEYKKVGVAIYADGVEDIQMIYNKISMFCDFIHLDIVDSTFKKDCPDVKAYRAEVVRAYWQKKRIEVHIMSRKPMAWLPDLLPYVDVIYVHADCDEDLFEVFAAIRRGNCEPGLVISLTEKVMDLEIYLPEVKYVLVLAIRHPGFSGQVFDVAALQHIEELDKHKLRNQIKICVDGGVNNTTIQHLNVESVVSGSYVLNAENPKKNIIYLQTSGEYEPS